VSHMVQAAGVVLLAFGAGAATVSVVNDDIPDMAVPEMAWNTGSALDGKVFYTDDTVTETGEQLQDIIHFVDGTFQSEMCQVYCDFGWSDYETWIKDDVIHFTTTTFCPDAPHTVVWYGTVVGDEIEFAVSWTTRRWYWTHQINATGFGNTTPHEDRDVTG